MIHNKIKHRYINEKEKIYWRKPEKRGAQEISFQKVFNNFNVLFNDEKGKIKENEDKITLEIFKDNFKKIFILYKKIYSRQLIIIIYMHFIN